MGLKGHFLHRITITAVERASHKAYTGTIPTSGEVVLPPQVEVSQEEGANRVITKYFNPNLIAILDLPPQEGTYDVHAQLGDQRSNTVTIQLKQGGR
jgi:hypothetical protein